MQSLTTDGTAGPFNPLQEQVRCSVGKQAALLAKAICEVRSRQLKRRLFTKGLTSKGSPRLT